jgi:large subunit ribosomal protein L15
MKLEQIPKRINRKGQDKRLGRGMGSGVGGHTVGRGTKGQKSRSGHKSMALFEGGNLPFYKKTPKYRGFKSLNKVKFQPVNISELEKNFKPGDEVSLESLTKKNLVRKKQTNIKILGYGELKKKLVIKGLKISESAKKIVEDAGGKVE